MTEDSGRKRQLPRTGYPRRRATTACEVCRERKRRCDNSRPSCSFCQNIGVRCEYRSRDDVASLDPSSLAILDRLSVLESLMRQHNCSSAPGSSTSSAQQQTSPAGVTPGSFAELEYPKGAAASPAYENVWNLHTGDESRVRLDTIMQWPCFEKPLSGVRRYSFLTFRKERDYTYFEDIFQTNPGSGASPTSWQASSSSFRISTERAEVERLIDRFFAFVHVKNPILDRQIVMQYCQEYCEDGPLFNLRSCLVLLLCALGSAAMEFSPSRTLEQGHRLRRSIADGSQDLELGRCYFAAAEKRLAAAFSDHSTLAVQCLCLAGIYHMFMVNPRAGQAMFHSAGYIMQVLASTGNDIAEESPLIGSGLYWACFKSERELFAEIPIAIPALGRPSETNTYPLPPHERFNDMYIQSEQDSWYFFLSELAMRRILDKASEVVGNFFDKITRGSHAAQQALDEYNHIALELERQTLAWREQLPPSIQFPDPPTPADTEWQLYSRAPFLRTLELLHRPFVFAVLHELVPPSAAVRERANKGLWYAFKYLQGCHPTHSHHGRALQLRNEMKAVCILFAACGCADLDPPAGWYDAVRAHVRSLRYWERGAPFLRSYIGVMYALDAYFEHFNGECVGQLRQEADQDL